MKKECTYLQIILVNDDIFGHPTYGHYCELYKREVLEINCIKCKSRKLEENMDDTVCTTFKPKAPKINNEASKLDAGKLQIRHVPPQIIRDIAEIRMYGIEKYKDPENWKRVELERYIDALLRHTLSFMEDNHSMDEESGKEHYKHMACNMAFICELMAKEKK